MLLLDLAQISTLFHLTLSYSQLLPTKTGNFMEMLATWSIHLVHIGKRSTALFLLKATEEELKMCRTIRGGVSHTLKMYLVNIFTVSKIFFLQFLLGWRWFCVSVTLKTKAPSVSCSFCLMIFAQRAAVCNVESFCSHLSTHWPSTTRCFQATLTRASDPTWSTIIRCGLKNHIWTFHWFFRDRDRDILFSVVDDFDQNIYLLNSNWLRQIVRVEEL